MPIDPRPRRPARTSLDLSGVPEPEAGVTTPVLGGLRVAASLAHALPGLRARIGVAGRPLLEVARIDDDERLLLDLEPGRTPVCSPCAFRQAVGDAHRRHQAGEELSFLRLPAGVEPAIEIATPPGGASRPGGLHRVPLGAWWLWAFASTLPIDDARAAAEEIAAGEDLTPCVDVFGIRWDPVTEVSLGYVEVRTRPGSAEEATAVDLLERVLAAWTGLELVAAARRDPR